MRVIAIALSFLFVVRVIGSPQSRAQEQPATTEVAGAEVEITGDGFTMPATLELPAADGAVPCVIFEAGSGPTDRNWNSRVIPQAGGNGSAQQLAEALRARGIGSIRYDKIASGSNTTSLDLLSLQHYVDEGLAAYRFMSGQEACGRIFFLGSSEGGIHVLRTAVLLQSEPDFGGVVTMSGAGRSELDTMIGQIRRSALDQGYTADQVDAGLEVLREAVVGLPGTVTDPPDFSVMPDLALFWQQIASSGPPQLLHDLLMVDPLDAARAYQGPILVMSAANDAQVPVSDGDAIFEAVPDVGQVRRRTTIPDANHVYKQETRTLADTDEMTLVMAYWEQGRPLAPGTVDAIVEFISAVAAP